MFKNIKSKRFVVLNSSGKEVDGFLYKTRKQAINGVWNTEILFHGYWVKRVNVILDEHNKWQRKDSINVCEYMI